MHVSVWQEQGKIQNKDKNKAGWKGEEYRQIIIKRTEQDTGKTSTGTMDTGYRQRKEQNEIQEKQGQEQL